MADCEEVGRGRHGLCFQSRGQEEEEHVCRYEGVDKEWNCNDWSGSVQVEFDSTEGGVLKLEAHILNALKSTPLTLHLLDSGSTAKFWFVLLSTAD